MEQRSFQSLKHDLCTGLFITFQTCCHLLYFLGSVDISRSTTANDTFFYGCSGCSKGILKTKLCFLHFGFCSGTYTDNCYAACKLCKSFL